MKHANRLWMFFILIAAGLVYSYAMVGKRYQQAVSDSPATASSSRGARILNIEEDCRPFQVPCAAYAASAALVLRLRRVSGAGGAPELAVEVAQVGLLPKTLASAELILGPRAERGGAPLPRFRAVASDGVWKAVFPLDAKATRLEVRLDDGERVWVAEYPL